MSIKMPDFSPELKKISKTNYNIRFLEDGYPGKYTMGKIIPHPLYGIYVISDYLVLYSITGEWKYIAAAIRVADAAIGRMKSYHNSLVFWYPKNSTFNSTSKDYFSALTQSYYAEVFAVLFRVTKTAKYKEAAEIVYSSLKIPVSKGGVLHASTKGVSIQELPLAPNGYILNGWLSAICSIKTYANLLGDDDAQSFWRQNLQTLGTLLPNYDAPVYLNSRYALNGMVTIQLVSAADKLALTSVKLNIPDEGRYIVPIANNVKYSSHIVAGSVKREGGMVFLKNKRATLQLLLSRYSYPRENEILLTLYSQKITYLQLMIKNQKYSPKGLITTKFSLIRRVLLKKGVNTIKVKIPWTVLGTLGIPTTFKKFGSNYYNVYHFTHLNKLLELIEATEDKRLLLYYEKWKGYTNRWGKSPLYADVEKTPFVEGRNWKLLKRFIQNLLSQQQ